MGNEDTQVRDAKLSTTVTAEEKQSWREEAAKRGMNMSEFLREVVYDALEENEYETSRETAQGNTSQMTPEPAD